MHFAGQRSVYIILVPGNTCHFLAVVWSRKYLAVANELFCSLLQC